MLGNDLDTDRIKVDEKVLKIVVYGILYIKVYDEVYHEQHIELVNALSWVLFDRSRVCKVNVNW